VCGIEKRERESARAVSARLCASPPPLSSLSLSLPSTYAQQAGATVVITKPGGDGEGVYQVRKKGRGKAGRRRGRAGAKEVRGPASLPTPGSYPPKKKHPHTQKQQFPFDAVLGPDASQAALYAAAAADVVAGALAGYHGTVLAYGQTGSGKTYSMTGPGGGENGPTKSGGPTKNADPPAHLAGIVPRAVEALFAGLTARGGAWSVGATYVEVYNEGLRDLLAGGGGGK
jgi:hypothetical protein